MDELKAYSASLADSVSVAATDTAVTQALRAPHEAPVSFKQRLTTMGIVIATFLSANVGLAAASQNAAPGDLLYGVDRAYERVAEFVGISSGRTEERLQEATELVDRGDASAALAAGATALESLSSSLEDPGSDLTESLTEATHSLADLPPAAENAQPEFVADVLAETRLFLQLVEQVRWAAQNGEPGDARMLPRLLRSKPTGCPRRRTPTPTPTPTRTKKKITRDATSRRRSPTRAQGPVRVLWP